MSGKLDKAKGRVKAAAGVLIDDESLKRRGKIDQAAGTVKDAVEGAVDTVKKTVSRHKG